MHQGPRILVVDDEVAIRRTMGDLLERKGYAVLAVDDGAAALAVLEQQPVDLLLVDICLAGMSGIELARRAHAEQPDIATIILTGHGALETVIEAMHVPVFDYLLKTTDPQYVLARIDAALAQQQIARNQNQALDTLQGIVRALGTAQPTEASAPFDVDGFSVGDLHISSWSTTAWVGERRVRLTPTELRILGCLAQQCGQVLTAQQIVYCAQGYAAEAGEAVDLLKPHIYHLRRKLERDPARPQYIVTVRGIGYLLSAGGDGDE